MPTLQSDLALQVYQLVFHGVDRPLGDTLDEAKGGTARAVSVPDDGWWYVRHADRLLGDDFLPTLAKEIANKKIPGLSLASCRNLTDACAKTLGELTGLAVLDLFNTHLGPATLNTLAGLKRLTVLNLAGTPVTDESLRALHHLPRLETLHLGHTTLDDAMVEHLRGCTALKRLDLRHTRVTDAAMEILAALPALESLDLQGTVIGDAGIQRLLPARDRWRHLYLGYTQITDASLASLKELRALRTLMLRATTVSREHDGELQAALTHLGALGTGPAGIQEGLIR